MSVITNSLLIAIVDLIDDEISYGGVGNGVAPQQVDTSLDSELIRKLVTGYKDNTTLIKEIYLAENEANGVNYSNTGLFNHEATNLVDTGKLLFGSDVDFTKNATENATISFEITIKRGV